MSRLMTFNIGQSQALARLRLIPGKAELKTGIDLQGVIIQDFAMFEPSQASEASPFCSTGFATVE